MVDGVSGDFGFGDFSEHVEVDWVAVEHGRLTHLAEFGVLDTGGGEAGGGVGDHDVGTVFVVCG